jgi:hypothetical protein
MTDLTAKIDLSAQYALLEKTNAFRDLLKSMEAKIREYLDDAADEDRREERDRLVMEALHLKKALTEINLIVQTKKGKF